jgi:hypothetical protein
LPFEKLHDQKVLAVDILDGVDDTDVGMVQSGGGAGFALEAFTELRVLRHLFGQEFQGHAASQAGVFRFVDDAHAAAGYLAGDVVMGKGLTDPRLAI